MHFRSMWERYCRGVNAIVYMVDAADLVSLAVCKDSSVLPYSSFSSRPLQTMIFLIELLKLFFFHRYLSTQAYRMLTCICCIYQYQHDIFRFGRQFFYLRELLCFINFIQDPLVSSPDRKVAQSTASYYIFRLLIPKIVKKSCRLKYEVFEAVISHPFSLPMQVMSVGSFIFRRNEFLLNFGVGL